MAVLARRSASSPLTDLFDWFESGWPAMAEWRREGLHALRIEDRLDEDRYVLRAEIPGIDPEKDVAITVTEGVLTIKAERKEEVTEKGRSEFHYGSFMRQVTLPQNAREDDLSATYKDGILEVAVPLEKTVKEPKVIPVARASED